MSGQIDLQKALYEAAKEELESKETHINNLKARIIRRSAAGGNVEGFLEILHKMQKSSGWADGFVIRKDI